MKLVASMMGHVDEFDRYLSPAITAALGYSDEVRIRLEVPGGALPEDLAAFMNEHTRPVAFDIRPPSFFQHEGRARQELLEFTLAGDPDWILAIDADEFVTDGAALRTACVRGGVDALQLCMQEVWNADADRLQLRQDGGWREHDVAIAWAPRRFQGARIPDRQMACPRTPMEVNRGRLGHSCSAILHCGWLNRETRQARYDRYVKHDGGNFHARTHLDSIMLPDSRIELNEREWPAALFGLREQILACANA